VTPVRIQASYEVKSFNTGQRLKPKINQFNGDTPNKMLTVATKVVSLCQEIIAFSGKKTILKTMCIENYVRAELMFVKVLVILNQPTKIISA